MIRLLARAAALFVAVPFLVFASGITTTHLHGTGATHDGAAVAHSHFGPHAFTLHQGDDTEIEHDIEHILWLDSPILHEGTFHLVRHMAAAPSGGEYVLSPTRWVVVERDDAAPPHGPPKVSNRHRGPPTLLA
ncbi:MAG TPA: hypothetical protein VN628_09825 [Vicinamibacterales bacterium]|nr:hypothetical protein [Vicinamibacterales bacterium]